MPLIYKHMNDIHIPHTTQDILKNSLRIRMAANASTAVRRTRRDKERPAVLLPAGGGEFLEVEHFAKGHACFGALVGV